ncbi:glycoside hydrolase family 2 TIM barrel-domain containing protein [Plebeiibacterium marinum]|uniref:Beta-glucuronidase n=1 Tax=Plebeiibacterium marinum TaxID=2992111 RepID=A0AAE3SL90_9BACT|nr:glycoside hydrolase family 2 TIM barrel-domain containing protein [Plebeiobacterium marinum]MCW3807353.1 hypothetical protein [Plebeiobacterium marinum]
MKTKYIIFLLLICFVINAQAQEFKYANPKDMALFPQRNETRDMRKLSGIWKFKKDENNIGISEKWYNGLTGFKSIAVPGSWNDQFTDMRDYRDWVWYETEYNIPGSWKGEQVYLRIGEASYAAKVWVNGHPVGMHEGGFVPFAFDVTPFVNWDGSNRISIQVENSIKPNRLPGDGVNNIAVSEYDIFPYAGLNRDVWLYSVPSEVSIKDITIRPDIKEKDGILNIMVELSRNNNIGGQLVVSGDGKQIEKNIKFEDGHAQVSIKIPNAKLWSPDNPFLYTVAVRIGGKKKTIDVYSLETGIRTITTDNKNILLNGKPIKLRGFGKQQDFPIYGRGSTLPAMVKDIELLKWMGANTFRTSDYPHDEMNYHIADKEGILIIDETPAIGLFSTIDTTALKKIENISYQYLTEMILRDKNHPSVIMWSLANGPKNTILNNAEGQGQEIAYDLFAKYINKAKEIDPTRLVMFMGDEDGFTDWFGLSDVICINRFEGWSKSNGQIAEGVKNVCKELDNLHKTFNKPCLLTQFGASSIAGEHALQPEMYSEEYQKSLIKAYLDMANTKDYISGMIISNFADYKTPQSIIRLRGYNTKGVFTRDRRPKAAAQIIRERWNLDKTKY